MKKRKHRKHWALINPIRHAIEGAAITPQELLDELRLLELSHLSAMRDGTAGLAQWRALADMLNLCETMAKGGIGPEALPSCKAAEDALVAAAGRFERTGRMAMLHDEYMALVDVQQYHDLQRQCVSRAEYERWINLTSARIRGNAAGVRDVAAELAAAAL